MNKKDIKYIIIIAVIFLSLVGIYFLVKHFENKNTEDEFYLKNYDINEYIPTYVSDEKMAKIYLNDFVNKMISDPEEAYSLIADDYRKEKFPTYNDFYNYLNTLEIYDIVLDSFYKKQLKEYLIFGIYDNYNNFYGFKTKGVMQYSVYLDEDIIEIW